MEVLGVWKQTTKKSVSDINSSWENIGTLHRQEHFSFAQWLISISYCIEAAEEQYLSVVTSPLALFTANTLLYQPSHTGSCNAVEPVLFIQLSENFPYSPPGIHPEIITEGPRGPMSTPGTDEIPVCLECMSANGLFESVTQINATQCKGCISI